METLSSNDTELSLYVFIRMRTCQNSGATIQELTEQYGSEQQWRHIIERFLEDEKIESTSSGYRIKRTQFGAYWDYSDEIPEIKCYKKFIYKSEYPDLTDPAKTFLELAEEFREAYQKEKGILLEYDLDSADLVAGYMREIYDSVPYAEIQKWIDRAAGFVAQIFLKLYGGTYHFSHRYWKMVTLIGKQHRWEYYSGVWGLCIPPDLFLDFVSAVEYKKELVNLKQFILGIADEIEEGKKLLKKKITHNKK